MEVVLSSLSSLMSEEGLCPSYNSYSRSSYLSAGAIRQRIAWGPWRKQQHPSSASPATTTSVHPCIPQVFKCMPVCQAVEATSCTQYLEAEKLNHGHQLVQYEARASTGGQMYSSSLQRCKEQAGWYSKQVQNSLVMMRCLWVLHHRLDGGTMGQHCTYTATAKSAKLYVERKVVQKQSSIEYSPVMLLP